MRKTARLNGGSLWLLFASFILILTACSGQGPLPAPPTSTALFTAAPTQAVSVFPSQTPTSSPAPFPSWTPAPSPSPVPTADPYAGLTIPDLLKRSYGGGELVIKQQLGVSPAFTRYLVAYPSDGLALYAFMDVPRNKGPFPVVIAVHGYLDPVGYQTLDYTTRYADALARAGYLVIHPNLRGYPPSEDGSNLFRAGFAIDVLNLVALVKAQGGKAGPLEAADPARIGMWGHSMGGGITIRSITVSRDIRAAVLYGAMSADDQKNFERIFNVFSPQTRGALEQNTPPEAYLRISPIYFLDRIQAAVSIHHGEADTTVPPAWSDDLCSRLKALQKTVECFTYPGEPHTFSGAGDTLFIRGRSISSTVT